MTDFFGAWQVRTLVRERVLGDTDWTGLESESWADAVELSDALFLPTSTVDAHDSYLRIGTRIDARMYVKSMDFDFTDALVSVDGGASWFRVVGSPLEYPKTPTEYCRVVDLVRVVG